MKSFSLLLKEHCADINGLQTVYVGDILQGRIIAGYNPGHLDTDLLTTHTTEVFRALRRLHASVKAASDASYFISTNPSDRLIVQQVQGTSFYLAFVTAARESLQSYLPTFKALLVECRRHFSDEIDIASDASP